jgi:hypothetical protein
MNLQEKRTILQKKKPDVAFILILGKDIFSATIAGSCDYFAD